MTINKTSFEKIYRNEHDAKTKERMLLVLNVVYNNIIPAHATKDLHRSRAWASDWLKRYDKEGIEGLKDRTKSGRPTEIPEEIELPNKERTTRYKQGWTTKQVEELIIKKSGIKYHYTHIYTVSFVNGALSKRFQERCMLILLHPKKRKRLSKKDRTDTCGCKQQQQQQQQQETKFTIVSLDESFFFYDSLVRRVWIDENKRPIVRVTGSHQTFMYFWCHKYGRKTTIQTV